MSVRSVQRYVLSDLGLHSRSAAKKPLLTPCHKRKRLIFAKEHKDWPLEKIRRKLWSDESVFTVTGTKYAKVRRPRNSDRYDPRYIVERIKNPDSLMVWDVFCIMEWVTLYFLRKVLL